MDHFLVQVWLTNDTGSCLFPIRKIPIITLPDAPLDWDSQLSSLTAADHQLQLEADLQLSRSAADFVHLSLPELEWWHHSLLEQKL